MPVTNAREWKAQQTKSIELELPSGLTVLVRRPPVHIWISSGKLPETLVRSMLAQKNRPMEAATEMTPEQFKELFAFMRETILATVIEPRITLTPQGDDEISPDDVPMEDGLFIFQWAMAGGATPPAQKANLAGSGVMSVDVSDLSKFRTF